jgi:hypothetical protein
VLCVVFTFLSLRRKRALRIGVHHWFLKMFGKLNAQLPVSYAWYIVNWYHMVLFFSFSFPSSLAFFLFLLFSFSFVFNYTCVIKNLKKKLLNLFFKVDKNRPNSSY